MVVFGEADDATTIQEAHDHCQTMGMDLFSPVNSGQVNKLQLLGLQGEGFQFYIKLYINLELFVNISGVTISFVQSVTL